MIDNCKINFILYFILNWQFFITQVTTIIYNFYRELYQIYVLLLLYPDKSLYENAEKPQRYPTLCHREKREFFFFFFFVRMARTESCFAFSTVEPASRIVCHAMNNTPLFLRFFTLCQRNLCPRMRQKCAICLSYSQRRPFEVPPLSRSRITFVKTRSPLLSDTSTSFKISDSQQLFISYIVTL